MPDSDDAIFTNDTTEEIRRKIFGSRCTDDVKDDPVYEYVKYVLLPWYGKVYLDGVAYHDAETVRAAWGGMDRCERNKDVANLLDTMVDRIRTHFSSSEELTELERKISSMESL